MGGANAAQRVVQQQPTPASQAEVWTHNCCDCTSREEPRQSHDCSKIQRATKHTTSSAAALAYRCPGEPSHMSFDSADIDETGRTFRRVVVSESSAGTRADKWLSLRFSCLSRTAAAKHLKEGGVLSEWRPLKGSTPLQHNEPLRLFVPGLAPSGPPPALPPILYEDERVLVINKPAGLLAHPAGDRFTWAVIGLVKAARPDHRADLVHRLDRDTSGVMVLTKDLEANVILKETFKNRSHDLKKQYLAIVRGQPEWEQIEVNAAIGNHPSSRVRLRRAVTDSGLSALTTFFTEQRMPTSDTSLEAPGPWRPETHLHGLRRSLGFRVPLPLALRPAARGTRLKAG